MKTYFNGWKRMLNFSGNSTRAQFWVFNIVNWLLIYSYYLLLSVNHFLGNDYSTAILNVLGLCMGVFAILYLIAAWTLAVRRLHDSGKSGWNLLWGVVPAVGWVILLVFYLLPSKR